jgi:hypothetical protein
MINGNVNEFIDTLYGGEEIFYTYNGAKYFIQGWWENKRYTLEILQYEPSIDNCRIWSHEADEAQECVESFQNALIFNGKSFWDVENEIEWIDD